MIYELRTYTVKPGTIGDMVKAASTVSRDIRNDDYGKLEGYWSTEIGPLNQVMHLWSYGSFDERARLRGELAKNPRWTGEYIPLIRPLLVRQDVRLLNAIKPPVATMVIMKYMSQKWDVEAISAEVKETGTWRVLTSSLPLDLQVWGSQPAGGDLRNDAAMTTTTPWMMPQRMKVAWYPAEVIILAMGATVNADPAPKPAAVNPAASPRWSGNHLRALPMAVPYTMPAPSPATA